VVEVVDVVVVDVVVAAAAAAAVVVVVVVWTFQASAVGRALCFSTPPRRTILKQSLRCEYVIRVNPK